MYLLAGALLLATFPVYSRPLAHAVAGMPEASPLLLLLAGVAGLAVMRRRRRS